MATTSHCPSMIGSSPSSLCRKLHWLDAVPVPVTEEQDSLALTFGTLAGLDPLTPTCTAPQAADETPCATFDISAVVAAHDGFYSLGSLISVVERNGADEVMQDVSLDDAVEKVRANGPEVAINGRGGATGESPGLGGVMRERGVSVLKEGYSNY